MKKVTLLLLGLFVAGLAAWAVPREYNAAKEPVKIEIQKFVQVASDVTAIDNAMTVEGQAAVVKTEVDASLTVPEMEKVCLSSRYRWQAYSFNGYSKTSFFDRTITYDQPPLKKDFHPSIGRPNRW